MNPNQIVFAALIALIVAAGIAAPAAAQSPHAHEHSFGDAQKWAKVFEATKIKIE